jgi:hypothetical protein
MVLEVVEPVATRLNTMKNELRSFPLGKYQILCVVDYDSIRRGLNFTCASRNSSVHGNMGTRVQLGRQ